MHCYFQIFKLAIISFSFDYCKSYHIHQCKDARIVGGDEVNIKDFPFVTALILKFSMYQSSLYRGGVNIVSRHWAITAAHCIQMMSERFFEFGNVFVRGGTTYWTGTDSSGESEYTDHLIVEHYEHPRYSLNAPYDNDIALVKVKEEFCEGVEKSIALAGSLYVYKRDVPAMVIGWGTTDYDVQSPVDHLRAVTIDLFDNHKCLETYRDFTENMVCGGSDRGGRDACNGDSGGPLVQAGIIIGVVSFGHNCGKIGFPGVYAKVSMFEHWIRQLEKELATDFGITFKNEIDNHRMKVIRFCHNRMMMNRSMPKWQH